MEKTESLPDRIKHNFFENLTWLCDIWNDNHHARSKLQRYYRWHFKELALCVIMALLLTRVDKVQQFFAAFSTDIKTHEQAVPLFIAAFGLNGLVIFWLCYVFWHKPARLRMGRWRRLLFGDRRRADFEAYYRKPGNAWRVSMVSSLPMLLVSGTLALSLLRADPLENKYRTPVSAWLEDNSLLILFGMAVLYLIAGSLVRPKTRVTEHHSRRHPDQEPPAPEPGEKAPWFVRKFQEAAALNTTQSQESAEGQAPKSAAELDALLGKLWTSFLWNLFILLATMTLSGVALWFYRLYDAPLNYVLLVGFTLWTPLAVSFFLNSFSECLIIETQKQDRALVEQVRHEPKFTLWYDRLMWTSYIVGLLIFMLCNNRYVTATAWFSTWMFPIAMLLFVFIAYYQALDLLVYNMTVPRFYGLFIVLLGLVLFFGQREHYRLKFKGEAPTSRSLPRTNLENYFLTWALDRYKTRGSSGSMDVYFVATEGGGSRAGAWTGAVLTALDSASRGQFRRQCFAISGVSGGALGAAATLALWDNANQKHLPENLIYRDSNRVSYLGGIFQRNYISTSLAGIFFYDALQQIPGIHLLYGINAKDRYSRTDRLQDEEDDAVCRGLKAAVGPVQTNYFKKTNFLSLYYESSDSMRLKTNLPLFFPNACRVEDGRRAIVSPILLDTAQIKVNPKNPANVAAVDVIGLYCQESTSQSLSLGEATSLSELFPFVNSTVFIDTNTGSFVDGGAYENLGLSTLYEVRLAADLIRNNPDSLWMQRNLPDSLRGDFDRFLKKMRFKMLLIYSLYNHNHEARTEFINHMPFFDPLTALLQTPFGGHTDYLYHKVKSELGAAEVIDFPLMDSREPRSQRADKIVMSRWLSKYEMNEIMKRASAGMDTTFGRLNLRRGE